MSMDLARKTFSCEPEYFIAGTNIRIATAVVAARARWQTARVPCQI